MPKLTDVQNGGHELNYASTPEQIQAYIDVLTEFMSEILSLRGSSIEEYQNRRKQIVADELRVIDEELKKLEADTDPLPV